MTRTMGTQRRRQQLIFIGLLLILWVAMALMTRVWLVPKKLPRNYDFYPRWYGTRESFFHGENPYSEDLSRTMSTQMGYQVTEDWVPHRFYYFATISWILLPFWLLPFPVSIVIWCGLQLLLLLILPLLTFWLLQWRIPPLLLAAVTVFSMVPWRHAANSYVLGQFTIFTLGCLLIAWAAVVTDHPLIAAAALVGATVRSEGAVLTAVFLLDLLLTRHNRIIKWWLILMAVVFGLSLLSAGFWLPDFLHGLRDYRREEAPTFPPAVVGSDWAAYGIAALVIVWGCWMVVQMRSLPDRYRLPWSLSAVILVALLVLSQTRDYTLTYALLPIWVILWAGRDQRGMVPLMLLILFSPWLYAAAKANQGNHNPVEQLTTPLILVGLLTYQWRRWKGRNAYKIAPLVTAAEN